MHYMLRGYASKWVTIFPFDGGNLTTPIVAGIFGHVGDDINRQYQYLLKAFIIGKSITIEEADDIVGEQDLCPDIIHLQDSTLLGPLFARRTSSFQYTIDPENYHRVTNEWGMGGKTYGLKNYGPKRSSFSANFRDRYW